MDEYVLGLFAWGDLGFAKIYCGMAKRAIDLTVPAMRNKTSLALSRSMATTRKSSTQWRRWRSLSIRLRRTSRKSRRTGGRSRHELASEDRLR